MCDPWYLSCWRLRVVCFISTQKSVWSNLIGHGPKEFRTCVKIHRSVGSRPPPPVYNFVSYIGEKVLLTQQTRRVGGRWWRSNTPILTGLRVLTSDPGWEVEVVPLVVGQQSVREKEWLEALRIFGLGKEDRKRIIGKLGHTILDEHEKLFVCYWWHTFGPQVICWSYWGKAYWSVSSSPPREVKVSLVVYC